MEAQGEASNSRPTYDSRIAPDHGGRALLRLVGLRATKQRLAVLDALKQQPHSTAEELLHITRCSLPGITVQSVYVVMSALVAAGLARKVELPDSPARYELETHDNHHHAVCRYCGRIEDVPCPVGEAPCLDPENQQTMTIEVAEVIYLAVCDDCAPKHSH